MQFTMKKNKKYMMRYSKHLKAMKTLMLLMMLLMVAAMKTGLLKTMMVKMNGMEELMPVLNMEEDWNWDRCIWHEWMLDKSYPFENCPKCFMKKYPMCELLLDLELKKEMNEIWKQMEEETKEAN